jgi:endoglucanase
MFFSKARKTIPAIACAMALIGLLAVSCNNALVSAESDDDGTLSAGRAVAAQAVVTYSVINGWSGGFQTEIVIKNNGTAAIDDWNVEWKYAGSQLISSMWNATVTQTGQSVKAVNAGYNKTIPAGGQVSIGFNATFSGTNVNPTAFTVNGQSSGGEDPARIIITSAPVKIEAEKYSAMSGVQTETCSEGTQNVGWIDVGDWLDYSVNVTAAGTYKVEYRVASSQAIGQIEFRLDGAGLGSVSVPNTAGWQTWTTVSSTVALSAGDHTIRIFAKGSPWNLNWFQLTKSTGPVNVPPTVSIQDPLNNAQFTAGANIAVSANAADSDGTVAKVEFYNGATLLGTDTSAPYQYTIVSAAAGTFTLKAVAFDTASASTASALVTVTVKPATGNLPPTVSIVSPLNGTEFTVGADIAVGANAADSDGTVAKVEFYSGATLLGTDTSSPYQFTLVTPAVGSYALKAVAFDNASSSTASAIVAVTVKTGGTDPVGENNDDWLHAVGSKVVDRNGNMVWMTGTNWFGFNTGTNAFDGLWSCNLEEALSAMADRGINLLRLPISTQLLLEWKNGTPPMSASINQSTNPNLAGKNSLQIFEITLAHCKKIGMKIMVDVHSPGSDAMGHMDPLWYKGAITPQIYKDTWVWLADRYKNDDTIVAFDLENEPHGKPWQSADSARWDASSHVNNWKNTTEETAKLVLAVHPNILIMVEGIEATPKAGYDYTATAEDAYFGNWWGGNLRGVKANPVNLGAKQAQLVYSPHDYGPLVYEQPWLKGDFTAQSLYNNCWKDNWAYIMEDNIAPLLIGEWGGFMDGGKNQRWMTYLRDYIAANKIHHTFWCFNANSGDTGGLVSHDFKTWDEAKYALLKPTLWQSGGKFVGLDHKVKLGTGGTNVGTIYP